MLTLRPLSLASALLPIVLLGGCQPAPSVTVNPLDAPKVLMVVPQTNGVGTNREIGVLFSKSMDPASITSKTFLVAGVNGAVTYDATNHLAYFKAAPDLTINTAYDATITTGTKDTSGTPLSAPYSFSFVTRGTTDASAPYVAVVNVAPGATGVPLNQKIAVTFDEQMYSLSINSSTFFIGGVTATVTYDVVTQTAMLTPSSPLAPGTTYTITVTTGAEDLGLVPLAAPFIQTFTTAPTSTTGTPTVALCPGIGNFAVLAGTTVTNTGPTTIAGDVGVSPGTAVVGFPPGIVSGTVHLADGAASKAQTTLTNAYVDAAGRSGGTMEAGDLAGKTLTSGVYASTSSLANSGDLTLDAQGDPNAVFIFQIGSTLTTGSGSHIILANGATACNVFWQVGSSATLGTNSVFKGNILALTSITITTGVNLQGRALARNGAVTLDSDVITGCTCP